jgi:hypothetical protein
LQTKKLTWLLLLYELPTRRTSARVHLWRKLKKFGAVPLKTSAYVLPDEDVQYERFQWLATQIHDAGGEATLIRVAAIEGMRAEDIIKLFNEARAAEYDEVVRLGRGALTNATEMGAELEKLERRFSEIRAVDYFNSPAADDARMTLRRLQKRLAPKQRTAASPRLDRQQFQGQTWLTRPRPGIDRAGSAWLIRTFIDRKARFIFGSEPAKFPKALPFDMADVEFSHHGDDCTFETLAKRFGITDKAVGRIAEMVHDADLEDGKFRSPECIGINCVLAGWEKGGLGDARLLAKGMECFEGLYQSLKK